MGNLIAIVLAYHPILLRALCRICEVLCAMLLPTYLFRRPYASSHQSHVVLDLRMACVFPHFYFRSRTTIPMRLDNLFTIDVELARHVPCLQSYKHAAGHCHSLYPTPIHHEATYESSSEDSSCLYLWPGHLVRNLPVYYLIPPFRLT